MIGRQFLFGERMRICPWRVSDVLPLDKSLSGKRCALSLVFICDGSGITVGGTYPTEA